MATTYRILVITRRAADLAVDHIVNTVHLNHTQIDPLSDVDELALATDTRNVFAGYRGGIPAGYGVETKLYNLNDPHTIGNPRPVRAAAGWLAYGLAGGVSGPREVALCLSYHGERNIARQRGRIYIGPWNNDSVVERPTANSIESLGLIAQGLANVGGVNVDWVVKSQFPLPDGSTHSIKGAWVDNEWDTIRSRGLRGTARTLTAIDE